ncbi:hypothetical protein R1flu_004054 [Riccia fluitans]|uniref:Uncharacterized protein n=1 Tax=Riccia fluitans TaxID=41844 RepID=A0ABD1YQ11_9MARC
MKRDRGWERTAKTYMWNAGVSSKRPGTMRTWRAGIITTSATAKPDRPGRIITARIVWSGAVHTRGSGVRRCHNPPGELLTQAAKSIDPMWPWDGKANDDGDDELAENAKLIVDGKSMTPS